MPKAPKVKVSKKPKPIHPNSRKALQLQSKEAHKDRVGRQKSKTTKGLQLLNTQLLWFQKQLEGDEVEKVYTNDDVCDLIETYLSRFDDELEEIEIANKLKGRKSRPHAAREDAIRITMERERALFEGPGFEAPDLTHPKGLIAFREWNCKVDQIQNIKMIKFRRKAGEASSSMMTE